MSGSWACMMISVLWDARQFGPDRWGLQVQILRCEMVGSWVHDARGSMNSCRIGPAQRGLAGAVIICANIGGSWALTTAQVLYIPVSKVKSYSSLSDRISRWGSQDECSPVRDGRELGVHDGDRLANGGEGGQGGRLRQPPLVRRRQPIHQRLRAQVQQQVRLRLHTKLDRVQRDKMVRQTCLQNSLFKSPCLD